MKLKLCDVMIGIVLVKLTFAGLKAQSVDNVGNGDLLRRIQHIEKRDKLREHENKQFKERVLVLENFVEDQQRQIHILMESINKQDDTNKQLHERIEYLETREKAAGGSPLAEVDSQKKRIKFIEWFVRSLADKVPAGRKSNGDNEESVKKMWSRYAEHRIQKRSNEETVAFFAYLGNHVDNPGVHQMIVFDHVTTNIGNGYNRYAGDFRAPVAGTYVFATTLLGSDPNVQYHFNIMHNTRIVAKLFIRDGGTTSKQVVLQLNQGDDVSIHNMDAGHTLYGDGYSTFSGFKLPQSYSSPAIIGR